jgi:hypothetical protein
MKHIEILTCMMSSTWLPQPRLDLLLTNFITSTQRESYKADAGRKFVAWKLLLPCNSCFTSAAGGQLEDTTASMPFICETAAHANAIPLAVVLLTTAACCYRSSGCWWWWHLRLSSISSVAAAPANPISPSFAAAAAARFRLLLLLLLLRWRLSA